MQQTHYEIATEISKRVKRYLETMTDFDDWELDTKFRVCGAIELIVVEELRNQEQRGQSDRRRNQPTRALARAPKRAGVTNARTPQEGFRDSDPKNHERRRAVYKSRG